MSKSKRLAEKKARAEIKKEFLEKIMITASNAVDDFDILGLERPYACVSHSCGKRAIVFSISRGGDECGYHEFTAGDFLKDVGQFVDSEDKILAKRWASFAKQLRKSAAEIESFLP
jgi:hypothetical protein